MQMFLEGEGEREREGRQRGRRSIETAGSFWQSWSVGGPIVMQRCINNATDPLNALLLWGPLCLSEQCMCLCACVCVCQ